MRRSSCAMLALLAGALLLNGCYGSFNLTRQVYHWNGQAGDRWPREFMFLILTFVPVYGVATLADGIIFNSIEFWQGKNPVEPVASAAPRVRRLIRGEDEAVLTYTPISPAAELYIDQFHRHRPAGSLRIRRQGGMTVGTDATGRVLLTATSLADGSLLIRDGNGKQMAAYSANQVDELLGSAAR